MPGPDQAAEALGMNKGSRGKNGGRKDGDGGQEVIKADPINESKNELMRQYKKMEQAREQYNESCKKVAENAGCNTPTIKLLIKASANGNFKEVQRVLDQRSVVFELIGEVAGGAETATH